MDGTKFNLSSKNAKDLTDEFISLVSKMYVGRKEFIEFKKLNKTNEDIYNYLSYTIYWCLGLDNR